MVHNIRVHNFYRIPTKDSQNANQFDHLKHFMLSKGWFSNDCFQKKFIRNYCIRMQYHANEAVEAQEKRGTRRCTRKRAREPRAHASASWRGCALYIGLTREQSERGASE